MIEQAFRAIIKNQKVAGHTTLIEYEYLLKENNNKFLFFYCLE